MLKILKQDFKRIYFSYGFLVCALLTFGFCFTAPVYTTNTGKDYTAFSVLTSFSKEDIQNSLCLSSYRVFNHSVNSYLNLFIPIVASFPFITAYGSERNSGNIRFTIVRVGKLRYCFSKFLSCIAAGGTAVVLGYFFYGIFTAFLFPSENLIPLLANQQRNTLLNMVTKITFNAIGMFLYGAVSALPAFLLAAFIHNKYIITCIPFMILYVLQSAISQISTNAINTDNMELLNKAQAFSFQSVQQLLFGGQYIDITITEILSFSVASFLLFYVTIKRKEDCGE